jgi:2-polyprenyl-3-methyl-5-hydroxy-6-metoxy-1,4-benzoquinol methylase
VLDVGGRTGHFSRRFARLGLSVIGIDPVPKALTFARQEGAHMAVIRLAGMEPGCVKTRCQT